MTRSGKDWLPGITRKGEPILMVSYVLTAYKDEYHQEVLSLTRGIHDTKYLAGVVFAEAADATAFAEQFAERLTADYIEYFMRQCRQVSDELLETAGRIRDCAAYDDRSVAELSVMFSRYSSAVVRTMTFLTAMVVIEMVLERSLHERLAAHCRKRGIRDGYKRHLSALISPTEKNLPSLALTELYELGAQAAANGSLRRTFDESIPTLGKLEKSWPRFADSVRRYLGKYDFMNMEYYVGRPLTPTELLGRIADVKDGATAKLQRMNDEHRASDVARAEGLRSLKLPDELISFIDSMRRIHFLRQYRADALFKAGRDALGLLKTIAERLSVDYETLISLTWFEILDSLTCGRMVVDAETIRARSAGYGIVLLDAEYSFVTGEELARELAEMSKDEIAIKITEVKGDVAFPGQYSGRVAVVTSEADVAKVRDGAVLVSHMTNPYYVPAMTRAGAIVTDEGGILSHAAIVSRELGIPCVVGTGNATSVLRDGMLVKVNAVGSVGEVVISY